MKFKQINYYQIWQRTLRKYRRLQLKIENDSHFRLQKKLNRKLLQLQKRILCLNQRWKIGIAISVLLAWLHWQPKQATAQTFELSDLDGDNGFALKTTNGFVVGTTTIYYSVNYPLTVLGDVNGDGIDDFMTGFYTARTNGKPRTGASYIVFGKTEGFNPTLELTDLDGNNGFVINGSDTDDNLGRFFLSGSGDINGDGINDIVLGSAGADPNGNGGAGESYVIFGKSTAFATTFELSDLDGTNGFVLNGIDGNDASGSATSIVGDVNGDGIDDLVIGAPGADPNGNSGAGESYIVFGKSTGFAASIELSDLDGTNGFVLNGTNTDEFSGIFISGIGDISGDGINDLMVGVSSRFAYDPAISTGKNYIIFGRSTSFSASLELSDLNGSNGFVLNGVDTYDYAGSFISGSGDVNGDGIDDIMLAAFAADPNSNNESGESYVIFGKNTGFAATLELSDLDGTNGFVLNGIDADDRSGYAASIVGDLNGDGIDDMAIGAPNADPNGIYNAGESYVIFGKSTAFAATLELSDLDGTNGFVLNGTGAYSYVGFPVVPAGDINGDGFDDLLVGQRQITTYAFPPPSREDEVYIIFGSSNLSNPLPITLLSFEGKQVDESIFLNWETSSEVDNDYYTIEHSLDAQNYIEMGIVSAKGAIGIQAYEFIDTQPNQGWNYYRLKQTDLDGTSTYIDPISIFYDNSSEFVTIFPNPTKNTLNIEGFDGQVNFTISNIQGQEIISDQGEDTFEVDLSDLPAGVYTLNLENKGVSISKKVMKQ